MLPVRGCPQSRTSPVVPVSVNDIHIGRAVFPSPPLRPLVNQTGRFYHAASSKLRRCPSPPVPDDAQVLLQEALAANRRRLFLLVRLPGSGKTAFARRLAARLRPATDVRILSTDYLIEKEARRQRRTYNELFDNLSRPAEHHYRRTLRRYLQTVAVIILDRTHLSARARARVTTLVERYAPDRLCLAVVMLTSFDECLTRNAPGGPPAGPSGKPKSAVCTLLFSKRQTRRVNPTSFSPTRKHASMRPTAASGHGHPHVDTGIEPFGTLHH